MCTMYKYLISSLSGVIHDSGGVTRCMYSCMHVLSCLYLFVCAAAISVLFKRVTRLSFLVENRAILC